MHISWDLLYITIYLLVHSLELGDSYMRMWTGSSLGQRIVCRLFGANALSKPMLTRFWLYWEEHISVKFCLKFWSFHSRKLIGKYRLQNGKFIHIQVMNSYMNRLRPWQYCQHLAWDTAIKWIFLNRNHCIYIQISRKYVARVSVNSKLA